MADRDIRVFESMLYAANHDSPREQTVVPDLETAPRLVDQAARAERNFLPRHHGTLIDSNHDARINRVLLTQNQRGLRTAIDRHRGFDNGRLRKMNLSDEVDRRSRMNAFFDHPAASSGH